MGEISTRCIPDKVYVEWHVFDGARVIASCPEEEDANRIEEALDAIAAIRRIVASQEMSHEAVSLGVSKIILGCKFPEVRNV